MFAKRLYIVISFCCLAILLCMVRLVYLQTDERMENAREIIRSSRIDKPIPLPTLRGGIYDRKNRELAVDKARFSLQVSYQLLKYLDGSFIHANSLKIVKDAGIDYEQARSQFLKEKSEEIDSINKIIDKCVETLGAERGELMNEINGINEEIWKIREFVAWKNEFKDISELYKESGIKTRFSLAMEDFDNLLEEKYSSGFRNQRFILALEQKLAEMNYNFPIYDIESEDKLVDIQLAFIGMAGVEISPLCERVYKYGPAACQIIGWVGPADPNDENKRFPNDVYSQYIADDYSGQGGIEKACEVILRGRRGEVTYSEDDELIDRKETLFGQDVQISIDIELQRRIEEYLALPSISHEDAKIGAVVIDVATGEILAMVSIPTYDVRTVRRNYGDLLKDPRRPLRSKAYYEAYPPGSLAKPIILCIGLEEHKVTPHEVIHCLARPAPKGWPSCMIFRVGGGSHDWRWAGQGGNIARNAIKGSCNIYFSVLADRLSSTELQSWLFRFGFGHTIMPAPQYQEVLAEFKRKNENKNLGESNGVISSEFPKSKVRHLLDLPPLKPYENRQFGIGQASMRATVLQLANAYAAIARRGVYKQPILFINDSSKNKPIDLGFSKANMDVVLDGMYAVVNENGGTAHGAFEGCWLGSRKIKIYGKTGSTERPNNALFGGFAQDVTGRAVAIAIVVEGGESGAHDAAPKARQILEFCCEEGYIGIDPKRLSKQ